MNFLSKLDRTTLVATFCDNMTFSDIRHHVDVQSCNNYLFNYGNLFDRFAGILLKARVLFWYVLWCQ